jgi:hypothetical protein
MAVVRFPGPRVAPVAIGALRCEECGAAAGIFAPGLPVRAWCSPACAAANGLEPWASCDLEQRERWGSLSPDRRG